MTARELAQAQFLLDTYQKANKFSDEVDPRRKEVNALDNIASMACSAFLALVQSKKHPSEVSMTELSTVDPAEWTKKIK